MNEKLKQFKERYCTKTNIIVCLAIIVDLFAIGYLLCEHYKYVEQSAGSNANVTIQQIERNNDRARSENQESGRLNQSAQTELINGQADLDRATERTGRLQESVDQRSKLIDKATREIEDSKRLIEEEWSIFGDIDRANQIPTTQSKSND